MPLESGDKTTEEILALLYPKIHPPPSNTNKSSHPSSSPSQPLPTKGAPLSDITGSSQQQQQQEGRLFGSRTLARANEKVDAPFKRKKKSHWQNNKLWTG